jgi:hypothetical protein
MYTILLSNTGESLTASSTEVHCTFTPTTVTIRLDSNSDCQSLTSFKHVLTAAAPGNNVNSLLWTALGPYQFRYGHKVQVMASIPLPPMEICYPALGTYVGVLNFDILEAGYPCAVEDTATGKLYTRMRVVNNDDSLGPETALKFTSGTVLLVEEGITTAPGATDRTLSIALTDGSTLPNA